MTHHVQVHINVPLRKSFTYALEREGPFEFPVRALIPWRNKQRVGFITQLTEAANANPSFKLKKITTLLDETPLFSDAYWSWLNWAAQYTLTPLGQVIECALPSTFLKPKTLEEISQLKTRKKKKAGPSPRHFELNSEQQKVFEAMQKEWMGNGFGTALLHGVTGSGKTEIYIECARKMIAENKQVLVMVPEIGLTPQVIDRFASSLADVRMAAYHSELTENEKLKIWFQCRDHEVDIVIGTRSSLFLPFKNCALIIIDEEHDSSFKQEEGFRYHGRELAIMRGKFENFPILLGTATPSIETFYNVEQKKYLLYELKERAQKASLPDIQVIDMEKVKRQTSNPLSLSTPLLQKIHEKLAKKEQSLILLNRRGFARVMICNECSTAIHCPGCSVPLIYHKSAELLCHYCDYRVPVYQECPACSSRRLTLTGIGTQTVEEELKSFFPDARILRLDRDSTTKKYSFQESIEKIKKQEVDIIVGTQMMAKGHDFPFLTLVGILGADLSLNRPDFRSAERIFQLLVQCSGRAGRSELQGCVFIQTNSPEHYSIRCGEKNDYRGFYKQEIQNRRELGYPPLGRMARFIFNSLNENELSHFLSSEQKKLVSFLGSDISTLGPAPCSIEKIRSNYRWHFVLRSPSLNRLHQASNVVIQFLEQHCPSGIHWAIDMAPLDFV